MAETRTRSFVVVPDGLEPRPEPEMPLPAAPYQRSLDYARTRASIEGGTIYLAPANSFGYRLTEQEAARRYLIENDFPESSIVCCPSVGDAYLDTRENAFQLKSYLERSNQWPLGEICLVTTAIHSKRANFWFEKAGFIVSELVGTNYVSTNSDLFVPRLWYYKYSLAHMTYEKLAFLRDILRYKWRRELGSGNRIHFL